MPTRSDSRRKLWWFAGGLATGLAGYMALRYPVETSTAIAHGLLRLQGATIREIPWPGGTLKYVMLGSGAEPLVMVHGIGDSPESFGLFAAGLQRDYRLCLPILPGHPGSPAPPNMQFGHMVQALDSVILREFGGQRVHLAGNSLGGWVSALFAAAASERLASLMLINPAGLHTEFHPALLRPETDAQANKALRAIFGQSSKYIPAMWRTAYMRAMQARSEPRVAQMMAEAPPLDEPLTRISVRTAVVIGEHDRLVPPAESRRAAELIPHATVEIIPGGSHLPHLTEPARLREIVRRHTRAPALLEA